MPWPQSERAALVISTAVAATVGVVALVVASLTGSQAIRLDGLFNAIYFVVGLVTLRVGRLVIQPDNDKYPFGYGYFESMVNACKGLLMLGVSALALFNSITALLTGGNDIAAGVAIGYAVFATLACTLTAVLLRRMRQHISSPLIDADIENWQVNALISAAVLAAFCLIPIAQALEWSSLTPYIDSALVIIVVVLCLGVPIRVAGRAIRELLNQAPPGMVEPVRERIDHTLAPLAPRAVYVRMVRPGRLLYVTVHVVLEPEQTLLVTEADAWRARLDAAVRPLAGPLIVETLFTLEERWAAPSAGRGIAES